MPHCQQTIQFWNDDPDHPGMGIFNGIFTTAEWANCQNFVRLLAALMKVYCF